MRDAWAPATDALLAAIYGQPRRRRVAATAIRLFARVLQAASIQVLSAFWFRARLCVDSARDILLAVDIVLFTAFSQRVQNLCLAIQRSARSLALVD